MKNQSAQSARCGRLSDVQKFDNRFRDDVRVPDGSKNAYFQMTNIILTFHKWLTKHIIWPYPKS